MNSKSWLAVISVVSALLLITVACSAGFLAGRFIFPATDGAETGTTLFEPPAVVDNLPQLEDPGNTPGNLDQLFRPFWQA